MNKIKVLHIISCFGMGGAETWLLETCRFISSSNDYNKKLKFDFLLIGGYEKHILDDEILSTGSKIHYTHFNKRNLFSFRNEFLHVLKTENYDVIHSHQDFISGWIFLAGSFHLPSLRITHLHNPFLGIKSYISHSKHRLISYHFGRLLTFLFTNKIIGTSNKLMNEYGYNKFPYKYKNHGALYCGISPKFYDKSTIQNAKSSQEIHKPEIKKALFVGRIDLNESSSINQKNPTFAFKIALELVQNNSNWEFNFVGYKGNLAFQFEKELFKLGLDNRIKFLGIRMDIPILMKESNVLVFPALEEGLGLVAVEAQSLGLPVLASINVPYEACIDKTLFFQMSLDEKIEDWVSKILELGNITKKDYASLAGAFEKSPFTIENSVANLFKCYSK